MSTIDRRRFLTAAAGIAGMALASRGALAADEPKPKRKFTICLAPGIISVPSDARKMLDWAPQFGFESIEPQRAFLIKLSEAELRDYVDQMKAKKLVWGAGDVPVNFKGDDAAFDAGMKTLPDYAAVLQRAGVTRTATWLSPCHRTLPYVANFRLHAKRLREVGKVFGDHGVRMGMEYVGPRTSLVRERYPFIHTMAEMKELIAEINRDNVGFLMDIWHWYTAKDTEADLLSLKGADITLCHLNDAPKDIAINEQMDGRRALPASTGVIDVKTFLNAMIAIGFDGPVAAEPFSQELRGRPPEENLATVSAAMKKAFALIE